MGPSLYFHTLAKNLLERNFHYMRVVMGFGSTAGVCGAEIHEFCPLG